LRQKNINEVAWSAVLRSVDFYKRFGAKTEKAKAGCLPMSYNFDRKSDPKINLKKYYTKKK